MSDRVISMTHYLSVVAVLPKPTEANKTGWKINVFTFLPWQASVAPNKHSSYFSLPKNTKPKLKRNLRDAFTTFLFARGAKGKGYCRRLGSCTQSHWKRYFKDMTKNSVAFFGDFIIWQRFGNDVQGPGYLGSFYRKKQSNCQIVKSPNNAF